MNFCRLFQFAFFKLLIRLGRSFVEELRQDAEESQQQLQQFRREVRREQHLSVASHSLQICAAETSPRYSDANILS